MSFIRLSLLRYKDQNGETSVAAGISVPHSKYLVQNSGYIFEVPLLEF